MADDNDRVLEELSTEECLELLAGRTLGRLAFVDDGQPAVVPVNYTFTPEGIVVRTDEGTKLEASRQRLVAFEVDDIDTGTHLGWSVLVRGHAFDVTDTLDERSEHLRAAVLDTWAPGPKEHRLLIETSLVTGRRLRRAEASAP